MSIIVSVYFGSSLLSGTNGRYAVGQDNNRVIFIKGPITSPNAKELLHDINVVKDIRWIHPCDPDALDRAITLYAEGVSIDRILCHEKTVVIFACPGENIPYGFMS